MGNPTFYGVRDLTIQNFYSNPGVTIELHQQTSGTFYYRLKLTAYRPENFPTIYLYLGSFQSVPNYNYTMAFPIQSVKDANLNDTSFEALFTQFSEVASFQPYAQLQSSASSSFMNVSASDETHLIKIKLANNNSLGPQWSLPTWSDQRNTGSGCAINTLTHSTRKGVQGASLIRFQLQTATARYGTSVSKYTVSVGGGFTASLTPAELQAQNNYVSLDLKNYPKLKGSLEAVFSVEDTRGITTSFKDYLTIVPYNPVSLTVNNTHRQGGTGSTVIFDFSGTWYGSPLTLTCNGIFAYEENVSAAVYTLSPVIDTSLPKTFSYSGSWSGASFDPAKAYKITAVFTDDITEVTLELPIPVGTPTIAVRNQKVGINKASPDCTLDVDGQIGQNGYPVLGYKGVIGTAESANLNDYTETGYYVYKADSVEVLNFPENNTNMQLLLMVISAKGYNNKNYGVQKAWEPTAGDEYTRAFHGSSFRSWKKVTMT